MIERDVVTPDGRTLRVREAGDPDGVAVMVLHGNPGAGIPGDDDVVRAHDRRIRLIAYDRPGYGRSTRCEGRDVAHCAADIRTIADALEIQSLSVWGLSGGGPHAAACAALLGDRVCSVAMLASVAPYAAPQLDYFAGMSETNVAEVTRCREQPAAARLAMDAARRAILDGAIDDVLAGLQASLPVGDRTVLAAGGISTVRRRWLTGLAPGADGWWDDTLATVTEWGFGLDQIRRPVLVVHGREDPLVPATHGEWLAATIPGAHSRILDGEGHFSLLGRPLDEVYDWLLERAA